MSIGQGNITVQSKKEAGEATQANNGLTLTGNLVQLGGGLVQNTFIGLNSNFELSVLGSDGDTVLLFDEPNGIYFFGFDTAGDKNIVTGFFFDETNTIGAKVAGKTVVKGVETISGLEAYLGDIDDAANGTKIFIDDNNGDISLGDLSDNLNSIKLKLSNQFRNITMGDPDGEQNGTTLIIDDSTQSVEITNVPAGAITDDFATFDGDQIKKIPAPVESGTYTPTISNAINVATSSPSEFQYMRVGNVVTVSGQVTIETTAAANTLTSFELSIPIASSFPNGNEIGGTLWGLEGAKNGGGISCTGANAQAVYYSASIVSDQIFIHFTYLIVAAP